MNATPTAAIEQQAAKLVAAHYRRKAARHAGSTWGAWNLSFAAKAEQGRVNPLVLRVRRILGGAA